MTGRRRRLAQRNGALDKMYGQKVRDLIRARYSHSAVEAILNNYLDDPGDEKYAAEFKELQAYRAECKARARLEVYGEEVTS